MPSAGDQLMPYGAVVEVPIADQLANPVGVASNVTLATPEPLSLAEAVTLTGVVSVAPFAGAVIDPLGADVSYVIVTGSESVVKPSSDCTR